MAKRFTKPPVPPKPPPAEPQEGWGARIESMFSRGIHTVLTPLYDFFSGIITGALEALLESIEAALLDAYKDDLEALILSPLLPPPVQNMIKKALSGTRQIDSIIVIGVMIVAIVLNVRQLLEPFATLVKQEVEHIAKSARVDPSTGWQLAFRNPDLESLFVDSMADLGWDEQFQKAFRETVRPVLPEASLTRLWFRFPEMRGSIEVELKARGYTPERIENLILSNRIHPGVNDVIRFAVRDVFTQSIVDKFQLGAEFPTAFGEEAERLGLADGADRLFWKSHWVLPGAQLGYQMFHRLRPGRTDNPFTKSDLEDLIKALDFSPFWRGRLIEIAEALPTRVDIRSMLREGIIDHDTALESYRDRGYNDFWANALTDFAAKGSAGAEKNLTRSAIQTGYERGLFTFDEATQQLLDLGFDATESDFWLALVDLKLAQDLIDEEIKITEKLYVAGEIEAPGAFERLNTFNLPAEQIDRLLTLWDLKRQQKIKLPTKSELDNWYKRELIDSAELLTQLNRLGWDDLKVDLFTQELDLEKAELAAKEAERAQIEQERAAASQVTSQYQKDKAEIDLRIALVRLEIADLRVATNATDDGDLKTEYAERILDLKSTIAQLQVQKADLKVDLTAL